MKFPFRPFAAACMAAMLSSPGSAGETLTLDRYLEMVAQNNSSLRSTELSVEASRKKILELDMVYSPYITGGYSFTDDRSGAGFGSTLPTDHMRINALNVSLNKKFMLGTAVSAGYSNNIAAFSLADPVTIAGSSLSSFRGYDMKPVIRAEQSLLRDFKSGLTQAGIQKAKSADRAQQYMRIFGRQQTMMRAKIAYWNLSLARDVVSFRSSSLERTGTLLRWNEERYRLDLADKSDLLQAQAGYKMRKLSLQQAQEEETNACRAVNELRGAPGAAVAYELERISDKIAALDEAPVPQKEGVRADVLAARSLFASSRYADREAHFRSLPELSVFGQYSLYGLGFSNSDAWAQVRDAMKPAYAAGISLIVPLDYKALMAIKQGYRDDFEASRQTLLASELSAENDWEQLIRNWRNAGTRLALAREIMSVQEQRVANEQYLLKRGRTTTFSALNAENDLDDATLTVYRLVFEKIATGAQAELYNTLPFDDDEETKTTQDTGYRTQD